MKKPLRLDPLRSALLLVDFQEEQRGPDYIAADLDRVLGNAKMLLDAARRRGVTVYHSAYRRSFEDTPVRPFEPLTEEGGPAFSDPENPLTDICHEVAPLDSETVIYKNDASAFSEGTLQPMLAAAGTEWLLVCGVWTEACIAATVRDAIAHGIHVLLIKDACGSGSDAMHETAVLNIANRLYGGAVTDTQTAVKLVEGREAEVWTSTRPVPILFTYEDAAKRYQEL